MIRRAMVITRGHLRVMEAMAALVVAHACLHLVSFRRLGWLTGQVAHADRDLQPPARSGASRARGIGVALRGGARRLPWHSTCLTRACAGRLMLARRRIPSMIVIGVTSGGKTRAHAWLVSEGGMVCGGREASSFTPLAVFHRSP